MDDRQVVDAFVAYLRANGYAGLHVDRRPDDENRESSDIDAIAGRFAIEHTSVDTLPNQRRDDDWFRRAAGGLEQELPKPPFSLIVTLKYDAVAKGQDWSAIRAALKRWIINDAPALPYGAYVVDYARGVPFRLSIAKSSDLSPGVSFARYQPEDDTLSDRVRDLFDRKVVKLANYRPGKTTILLVESGDKALMDECKMLEAIREAYPAGFPAGVDQVWYTNTSIAGNITFREFTLALREDQEDLAAFEVRAAEPMLAYEELRNDLKALGRP